ncbi:hypothetical protein DSO57_1013217 [Entomophthora muscae]|uniref:Uncharacterized protein n=1 Tax=Entomophthora muscae TaxID=34485 RepID=A0ACC2RWW6_9FUNG|nr:hypothetical protein DSO57_1013217 [Entomophthora muscae]
MQIWLNPFNSTLVELQAPREWLLKIHPILGGGEGFKQSNSARPHKSLLINPTLAISAANNPTMNPIRPEPALSTRSRIITAAETWPATNLLPIQGGDPIIQREHWVPPPE